MQAVLKNARKSWQLTEAFSRSLYALLDRTPHSKVKGLRVSDESGQVFTVERFERTKVSL